ncbi:hypothetical protein PLICRDRAFT_174459 [Plicaturopsis crispa FD-325 SS-3]|nr:hypothetical protein PLICRDRAFT_174459 [Plicaturopsis crispa FD-325 SS-3]
MARQRPPPASSRPTSHISTRPPAVHDSPPAHPTRCSRQHKMGPRAHTLLAPTPRPPSPYASTRSTCSIPAAHPTVHVCTLAHALRQRRTSPQREPHVAPSRSTPTASHSPRARTLPMSTPHAASSSSTPTPRAPASTHAPHEHPSRCTLEQHAHPSRSREHAPRYPHPSPQHASPAPTTPTP